MDGEQIREFHMPRFAIALAVIALFAAVLAPTAGATSPSQDQYGSALPGVGRQRGRQPQHVEPKRHGGSRRSRLPRARRRARRRAAPSDARPPPAGNGGRSSHAGSKGGSSHKSKGSEQKGSGSNNGQPPVSTNNASVPHIAADSAGDSWVPWFIGGLLALGAAGGVLVYRNRRRAAQS